MNHKEPEPGTDPELEPDPDENDKVEPECIIKEEPIDTEEDDHDHFTALNGDQTQEEIVKEEPEDFLEQSLVEESGRSWAEVLSDLNRESGLKEKIDFQCIF